MTALCKNGASANFNIFAADSSDGITGKTGLTITGTGSKDGGAYAAISGSITELSNGNYKVAANGTDSNTNGLYSFHGSATGAHPIDAENILQIVPFDPLDTVRLGLTALPNVASGSAGAIPTTGTGANQIAVDGAGNAKADVTKWNANTLLSGKLDLGFVRQNTMQSGSTSTTAKLDTGSSSTDNDYNGLHVLPVSGTGLNQAPRLITGYVGSTRVATVTPAWTTTPDNTTGFVLASLANLLYTASQASITTLSSDAASGLASLQADTDDIQVKIGTPAGASVSADIAAIDAVTSQFVFTVANQVDANALTGGGGGGGGSPGAGLGQYRYVENGSILVFDFFVQKMLVDSTETDPKVGKTGLVEANFTVKAALGGATSFSTIGDGSHAIIELGDGFYRLTAGATTDYTDSDGEALVAIYTVTDLSDGAETGLVWTERYKVGTVPATLPDDANAIGAAALEAMGEAMWGTVIEGSATAGDLMRALVSGVFGKVLSFLTGTLVFKGWIDTAKTRATVTTDSTGRLTSTPGDLT